MTRYYDGTHKVSIREVLSSQDPSFRPMMELYEKSFADDEKEPGWKFERSVDALYSSCRLQHTCEHFLVCEDVDQPVGMIFFSYLRVAELGFLIYLAVDEDHRGKGHGTRLFKAAVERCRLDAHYLNGRFPGCVMEVERLDDVSEGDAVELQRKKQRLELFDRLGATMLSPAYVQPALTPDKEPAPLNLMWLNVDGGATSKEIIEGFYSSVFALTADHEYVRRTVREARW
jgi:GNAT superfamily N-acetyltransferase